METPDLKLLLADDDDVFRERLGRALATRGFAVRCVAGGAEAVAAAKAEAFDAALVDMKMPTQPEGAALVAALHGLRPEMRIVVLTGYGSIASALLAVREGAADYLTKPADADQVAAAIRGEGVRPPRPAAVPSLDRVDSPRALRRAPLRRLQSIGQTPQALTSHQPHQGAATLQGFYRRASHSPRWARV